MSDSTAQSPVATGRPTRADRAASARRRPALDWPAAIAAGCLAAIGGGCRGPNCYRATEVPSRFAAPPVENVRQIDLSRLEGLAVNSELIDRGDVLSVTIITDYARLAPVTVPVRVGEDGSAEIPQIGQVSLAGLDLEEAEQAIAAAGVERNVFRNPHVTVTMRRQRTSRVTVIGAVKRPGVVELPRGASSLLAALVEAGGLAEEAGSDVEIRRSLASDGRPRAPSHDRLAGDAELASYESDPPGPQILRVSLTESTPAGGATHALRDGDVVVVSKRTLQPIHVIGLVHKPNQYELPPNQEVRVLDALAMAGDRTMQAADKVLIIRRVEGRAEPIQIEVSVAEAKRSGAANLRLAPGDVVSVEDTPVTMVLSTFERIVRVAIGGSVGLF